MSPDTNAPRIDVAATLKDKRILFVGSTGFVGKVALSMFLRRYPGLGKMFVLVRPGAGSSAEDRFFKKVAGSPVFDPIREVWGAGFDAFLREKVAPLAGDVSRPMLNFSDEDLKKLEPLDVIINCAGLVSFDPALETGLRINTYGVKNVIALARRTHARVVHISTCFVAGNRDGEIWEDEPVAGHFPRNGELGDEFSVDGEISDCEKLSDQVRAQADDRAHLSSFREKAAARLRDEGRDPDEERNIKVGIQRERKMWVAERLSEAGMERAQHWGWPNTYTYTKSLGDQICAAAATASGAPGDEVVPCTLVRPAIVESALRYPFPGWNEGFTTTAPLTMLTLLGQRQYPIGKRAIIDIIPVDMVASALIAATAAILRGEHKLVYQLGSSDINPLYLERAVVLLGLYKRRYFQERIEKKKGGSALWNRINSRLEPYAVSRERFNRTSAPRWRSIADGLISALDEVTPRWGAPRLAAIAEHARGKLEDLSSLAGQTADAFETFMPFVYTRRYVFRCDNTRALFDRLSDEDRAAIPWNPESIDWRHYWMDVHMRGLEKWVFPSLEEEFQAKPRSVYTYRDLVEMFDATTKTHRQRTAMRMLPPVETHSERGGHSDGEAHFDGESRRYTYADLQEMATRAAAILRERGVVAGDKVMLLSENRPEWGISYFAILKAGGSVVPVDMNATGDEVTNLLRSSRATALLVSERVEDRLKKEHGLDLRGEAVQALGVQRLHFDELLFVEPRVAVGALVHKPKADDVASLIFTSGTTGRPKGVMLSHRNFSSLLSKLAGVFDIDKHDGLLSVLPLHHTFEFTAGLLVPLMRGAQISYLDEVSADDLNAAFSESNITGGITGMVGVPALWQLLHRRMTKQVADRGPLVVRAFDLLVELNRGLRDKMPASLAWLNLGKLLFFPIHQRFGGRLRLLISGGSALPVDVMKSFRGLGFGLYEGYGLTEASPVLAVTRQGARMLPGSVGEPLPGVEVRIDAPDENGVGEVVAQAPNVMLGYFEDPEATAAAIQNGWLHTGDLGRIDADRHLYIVGRKKEMILGASGENVYPDELEDLYRDCPRLKELSIVGLPTSDGTGELVACLAVPDYERAATGDSDEDSGERLGRDAVRERIREHFRAVGTKLPLYKRVKVLHFTDLELPKTATRKVKRKLVVEELQKLERLKNKGEELRERGRAAAGGETATGARGQDGAPWLRELMAAVTGQTADKVQPGARLDELGFDSLMYTELGVALEAAGVAVPDSADLTGIGTVAELEHAIVGWGVSPTKKRGAAPAKKSAPKHDSLEAEEIHVPEAVARWGSAALDWAQKMTYQKVFDTRVTGRAYVPSGSSFLVAANHTSHLDMGLVKHAIGEWGPRLVALAAKDYFFEDPIRRAYFENFTSLVPMERHGSLRESLRLASEVMRQGHILLIFPEGTRSEDGTMADFKASIGYLSLQNHVDVLPMYLEGTHDAMPKGSIAPKHRDIAAHIGPLIRWQSLKKATEHLPRSEHYRESARIVEAAVRKLAPKGHPDHRAPTSAPSAINAQPATTPAPEREA